MRTANMRSVPRSKRKLAHFAPYIVGIGILAIAPSFLPSYLQSLCGKVLIFAIFAMSLDVIFGYTGLISLGHAAYFGVGSYAVGILTLRYGIESFWIVAPLAILMAAFVAAAFGLVVLRISGIYFLMTTFALGQLLVSIAVKWYSLTGGYYGLSGIPRPNLGLANFRWNNTYFYYFVFLVFIICFFVLRRFVRSPFGLTLEGIRENESRMQVMGYNTWLHKYIAFIVSGAFAGIAGMLFAYHNRLINPAHLDVATSTLAMLMVIIGGAGTLYGAVIGAALLILVEYFAGTYIPKRWPLVLGGVFVVAVLYARLGIAVHLSRLWKRVL